MTFTYSFSSSDILSFEELEFDSELDDFALWESDDESEDEEELLLLGPLSRLNIF